MCFVASQLENEGAGHAADADNEWDTVPSIPRFTHTHYSGRSPSPPNETVIEGCARPRRSTHIAGKMILSNQKWSLSIRDAYLVLIGTGPLKRRVPHSNES